MISEKLKQTKLYFTRHWNIKMFVTDILLGYWRILKYGTVYTLYKIEEIYPVLQMASEK